MQIEGIGILEGAPHEKAAKSFIDFVLSDVFQTEVPLTNWMFPVLPGVELPSSYSAALVPKQHIMLDYENIENNYDKWISMWAETAAR